MTTRRKTSYAEAIRIGRAILHLYIKDWQDFQKFDPVGFDSSFAQRFETAIREAEDMPDHDTTRGILTEQTEDLYELFDTCHRAYLRLQYFVEQAFPGRRSKEVEFGFHSYEDDRSTQARMIVFMRRMYNRCTQYAPELAAVGFRQKDIDELRDLHQQLSTTNTKQDTYKWTRKFLTDERKHKIATVWDLIMTVCRIGKIMYRRKDEVRLRQYTVATYVRKKG